MSVYHLLIVSIVLFPGIFAQKPENIHLENVYVTGNVVASENIICSTSGLKSGVEVNAAEFTRAVTRLWTTGLFDDVQIILAEATDSNVSITIQVVESPILGSVQYYGNKKKKKDDLDELLELQTGQRIKPSLVTEVITKIMDSYAEAGFLAAEVQAELSAPLKTAAGPFPVNALVRDLRITIDEGRKVRVREIEFAGNDCYRSARLRRALKETKQQRWYLFWRSPFNEDKYEEDKLLLSTFYRDKGYRDFRIVSDSVYYNEDNKMNIKFVVYEGPRYYYREFSWEGNQIYSNDEMCRALDLKSGEAYSEEEFNIAVYERMQSLYMDQGYIYNQTTPQITPAGEDSIDVHFVIVENHQVKINNIRVVGNTKTRENVIRRELSLYPGDVFNRNRLMRSQRNVFMLNYFSDVQPGVYPVDEDEIDLEISVIEKSSDQANMNIGFSGEYGITGGGGFAFNNFDIGHPFVSGNGQQLSLNVNVGTSYTISSTSNPSEYQSYNLSYTDPRFFDTRNLVGISLFHTFQGASTQYYYPLDIRINGASARWGRRFKWPDDYFTGSWGLQIASKEYSGDEEYIDYYVGYFSEDDSTRTRSLGVSVTQSIVRDSRDQQDYPSEGSCFSLSSTLSGGILGGNEDFHKHVCKLDWYTSPVKNLVLMNSMKLGFVDHIAAGKDSISLVPIDEKFVLGGSAVSYGNMLRGYEDYSIGPQYNGSATGGNILLRWSTELRYLLSPEPVIYLLAFAEAGNVWDTKNFIEPFSVQRNSTLNLKKSLGIGIRFNMPMVGLLGFDLGYGFDDIDGDGDPSGWNYHILFGQSF